MKVYEPTLPKNISTCHGSAIFSLLHSGSTMHSSLPDFTDSVFLPDWPKKTWRLESSRWTFRALRETSTTTASNGSTCCRLRDNRFQCYKNLLFSSSQALRPNGREWLPLWQAFPSGAPSRVAWKDLAAANALAREHASSRIERKTCLGRVFTYKLSCFNDVRVLVYEDVCLYLELKTRPKFSSLS